MTGGTMKKVIVWALFQRLFHALQSPHFTRLLLTPATTEAFLEYKRDTLVMAIKELAWLL